MFNTVGIIGLGLIGSSFAIEIKSNKLSKSIIGFDNDQESLDIALKKSIVDGYGSLNELGICDFVIVATPVTSIPDILKTSFEKLENGSIIIDVGSVKGAIIERVKNHLREGVYYVPIHPIAGIEKFGIKAAKKGLFKNAYCIITPFENINLFAMNKVKNFIKALDMKIEVMEAHEHDMVFSYISHLPHVIAYALVGLIEEKNNEKFKFIGGGFKDFTRISSSSEKMWSDIFIMNKKNVTESMERFISHMNKIKKLIEDNNTNSLINYLKKARTFKEALDEK